MDSLKVNWFWKTIGAIAWRIWWLERHGIKFRVNWSMTAGYLAGAAIAARWFA